MEERRDFADIGNRAGAFLLDFSLLLTVVSATGAGEWAGMYSPLVLMFLYFAGMPLTPLQGTFGKWICRIKLCDRQGARLRPRAAVLRAGGMVTWLGIPYVLMNQPSFGGEGNTTLLVGWWWLAALPWAAAGFMPRRETLFDLLAGSMVVRCKATPETIPSAAPVQRRRLKIGIGAVLLCLASGAAFSVIVQVQHDMDRRTRFAYAINETRLLQEKIEKFYASERRWPSADELGAAQSGVYPAGGGYRLLADGEIRITFAVLPDLKGRSINLRPVAAANSGRIEWRCSADAGIKTALLPSVCR